MKATSIALLLLGLVKHLIISSAKEKAMETKKAAHERGMSG